jgi:hypothetical protein
MLCDVTGEGIFSMLRAAVTTLTPGKDDNMISTLETIVPGPDADKMLRVYTPS